MALARGTVKAVLSGDTVIVMGNAQGGPPPEKQITLSNVVAPRLGRRDGSVKDEPFAWQSREFLRKRIIGKAVSFRIEQSVPSIGRDFGSIFLEDESVTVAAVAAGWLRLKPAKDARSEEYDELVRLESAAQEAGLGVWNKDEKAAAAAIRDVLLPENYSALEIQQAAGSEPQDAVVEQVVTGSTIRAVLLPRFIAVTVHLSGIQSPSIRRDGEQEVAEPFAREAKFFTESRLLHRDVRIRIEGIDKYQNFFGSVILAAGNITESLLTNGLAKVVEWSIKNNPDKDKLYKAERAAKTNKLRLWKDYVPPPAASVEGGSEFIGQIVEVVSGDVLVIKDTTTADPLALRRLALSSIRAPRAGNAKAGTKDEPGAFEAKDYVRQHFIGKKVKVTIDYSRPIPVGGEKTEDRQFASVETENRINVALAAVAAGWATVQRHRGDDPRSPVYDDMLLAEAEAQKANKGIHSKKPLAVRHLNDVSTGANHTAAKQFLPFLQRSGRVQGTVDYVVNGSRFKITIPKQSCIIGFALSGVRCPAAPRRDKDAGEEGGEPFGEAAWLFSREHVLQHDVEIEVETQDKIGTFIGTLWVGGRNLAVLLLEQGLARLQEGFRGDRTGESEQLVAAENKAKKAQLRLWQGFVEKKEETDSEDKPVPSESLQVVCTHVVDGTTLYLQSAKDAKDALPQVQEHLAKIGGVPAVGSFAPKAGDMVCGKYRDDGLWYRARILSRQAGKYNVCFVDFGNTDAISQEDLRPLPAPLASAEPLAKECQLAFLKPPKEPEYAEDALQALAELVLDRPLTATIEHKERTGRLHVTLVAKDGKDTVNQTLVREGLARVFRVRRGQYVSERMQSVINKMNTEQDAARRAHVNIWRYGDCVESDDDEPRPAAAAGGAAARR